MSYTRFQQLLAGMFGLNLPVSGVTLPAGVTVRNVFAYYGTGTPEAVVTAPIGSLYIASGGGASTTLYVKTSGAGNTGWTAK